MLTTWRQHFLLKQSGINLFSASSQVCVPPVGSPGISLCTSSNSFIVTTTTSLSFCSSLFTDLKAASSESSCATGHALLHWRPLPLWLGWAHPHLLLPLLLLMELFSTMCNICPLPATGPWYRSYKSTLCIGSWYQFSVFYLPPCQTVETSWHQCDPVAGFGLNLGPLDWFLWLAPSETATNDSDIGCEFIIKSLGVELCMWGKWLTVKLWRYTEDILVDSISPWRTVAHTNHTFWCFFCI